jgi:transposase
MGAKRRVFTREFKLEAVRLVIEGKQSVSEIAASLGVRPSMLRDWRRQVEGRPRAEAKVLFRGNPKAVSQEEQISRLQSEIETLRLEVDFLKKAAAYFAKERP